MVGLKINVNKPMTEQPQNWIERFDEEFGELIDVPDDLYIYGGTINTKKERLFKLNVKEVKSFIAKEKEESRREVFEAIMKLEWNYNTYEQQVIEREDIKDYAESLGIDLTN